MTTVGGEKETTREENKDSPESNHASQNRHVFALRGQGLLGF